MNDKYKRMSRQEYRDYRKLYKKLRRTLGKYGVYELPLPACLVDMRTGLPMYKEHRRWFKTVYEFPDEQIEKNYGVPVVARSQMVGNRGLPWIDECNNILAEAKSQGFVIGLYTVQPLKEDNIPAEMSPETAKNIRFLRYARYKPTREE